jgi:hypothetical protein
MAAIPNFWFTQTIATTVYSPGGEGQILDTTPRQPALKFLEIEHDHSTPQR